VTSNDVPPDAVPHALVARMACAALRMRGWHTPTRELTLGNITLLPHQVAAVDWLLPRLARYHGALLADPPGLGKTYVALAIAAAHETTPLVIAPAALRSRWQRAAVETGRPLTFISTERLSAARDTDCDAPRLVIIDEAHHLRTATTRRYDRTRALCHDASVLLLSATPIHNSASDLREIIALFHNPAHELTDTQLRRRITLRRSLLEVRELARGSGSHVAPLPEVEDRGTIAMPPAPAALATAINAIPALALGSVQDAHALVTRGLLHALSSSDAAAAARIRRQIAGTIAIEQAAQAGVAPTLSVRRAWAACGEDVQMAMPALLGQAVEGLDPLLPQRARAQREALEALLPMLSGQGDIRRSRMLRRLARWCRAPVVAFTQFEATADRLYQLLRNQPGIARLSGAGAEIASGVVSRADVLTRLLTPTLPPHQRVRLLLTTDVLSEGLSLSGVATIVHLDLPWTAARIDQRVGRAVRIGAPVDRVRILHAPGVSPTESVTRHGALLDRKRRAMDAYGGGGAEAVASVALLQRLAFGCMTAVRGQRRLALRTPDHPRIVRIAIVRLNGRRLLVAHEQGALRRVTPADWIAVSLAEPTKWRRGVSVPLARALREHALHTDLQQRVSNPQDQRLHARTALDGELTHGAWTLRADRAMQATLVRQHLIAAQRSEGERSRARRDARIIALLVLMPNRADPQPMPVSDD
jgi:hypothetical protein